MPRDFYDEFKEIEELFSQYSAHLEEDKNQFIGGSEAEYITSMSRFELASLKSQIIVGMKNIITEHGRDDFKKILELKKFLNKPALKNNNPIFYSYAYTELLTQGDVLKQHRNGYLFLQNLLHILTLGFYAKATKGSFKFWKSHGELVFDRITEITQDLLEENQFQQEDPFSKKNHTKLKKPLVDFFPEEREATHFERSSLRQSNAFSNRINAFKDQEKLSLDNFTTRKESTIEIEFPIDFNPDMREKIRQCFIKNNSGAPIKVECEIGSTRLNHCCMPRVRKNMEQNPDYLYLIAFPVWSLKESIAEKKRDICHKFGLPDKDRLIIVSYKEITDPSNMTKDRKRELVPGFEDQIETAMKIHSERRNSLSGAGKTLFL